MGKPKTVKTKIEGIKKAEGGKTVAEIFKEKSDLAGKEVVVPGKVVKYKPGILNQMGRAHA